MVGVVSPVAFGQSTDDCELFNLCPWLRKLWNSSGKSKAERSSEGSSACGAVGGQLALRLWLCLRKAATFVRCDKPGSFEAVNAASHGWGDTLNGGRTWGILTMVQSPC